MDSNTYSNSDLIRHPFTTFEEVNEKINHLLYNSEGLITEGFKDKEDLISNGEHFHKIGTLLKNGIISEVIHEDDAISLRDYYGFMIDDRVILVPYKCGDVTKKFRIEVRYFNIILGVLDGKNFYTDTFNNYRKYHPCFYTTRGILHKTRLEPHRAYSPVIRSYNKDDIYNDNSHKKQMISIHEIVTLLKGSDITELKPINVEDATQYTYPEITKIEFEFE